MSPPSNRLPIIVWTLALPQCPVCWQSWQVQYADSLDRLWIQTWNSIVALVVAGIALEPGADISTMIPELTKILHVLPQAPKGTCRNRLLFFFFFLVLLQFMLNKTPTVIWDTPGPELLSSAQRGKTHWQTTCRKPELMVPLSVLFSFDLNSFCFNCSSIDVFCLSHS